MFLLVMVEVVLILGPSTSNPLNIILAETVVMWCLVHIRIRSLYSMAFLS